jgi:glycosyltransferase involved in cell wall biosynthesis
MKIQIVMNFAMPVPALRGGAVEKRWHGLALELSRRHDVLMYSRQDGNLPQHQIEGRLRHLRTPGFQWSNVRAVNIAKSAAWALRIARQLEPADVLITNDILAPVLLPRLKRDLGLVCVEVARMPKVHYRWLYHNISRFYCVSSAIVDEMARVAPRRLPRCLRLPNSTDTDCYSPAANHRPAQARKEILYVGRIHPEKGLEVLLHALSLTRNRSRIFLRLVGPAIESSGGDSAFAERLRATARELKLTSDEWALDPPVFNDRALANIYRASDIFVYPSQAVRGEASPIAPLEAMACGKPCLVSALACFRDTVRHGESGLVVPSSDPADWAAALDELVDAPAKLAHMGQRSRELALDFRIDRIAVRLEDDLAQLLAEKPATSRPG